MDRVFDAAITDYYKGILAEPFLINNNYGQPDEMSLEVYFRKEENLNALESYALSLCSGRVLDVGAGVGALSLILQSRDVEVEALEISKTCCDILRSRGIAKVINQDFFTAKISYQYDTILMMMNGIGICGTIDALPGLFKQFNELLEPEGQVLLDSSDVSYLYEQGLPDSHYFGEIDYQYEYLSDKGPWFKWLYVDMDTLAKEAPKYDFQLQVLSEDKNEQYLGRLIRQE